MPLSARASLFPATFELPDETHGTPEGSPRRQLACMQVFATSPAVPRQKKPRGVSGSRRTTDPVCDMINRVRGRDMTRADEYRLRAKEALALMQRCQTSSRHLLQEIARAWLTLAHAAEVSSNASNLKRSEAQDQTVH
jgi:hypothetical protein